MKVKREVIIRDVYTGVEFDGETYTVYDYLDGDQRSIMIEVRDSDNVLVLDDEIYDVMEDLITRVSLPTYE